LKSDISRVLGQGAGMYLNDLDLVIVSSRSLLPAEYSFYTVISS